MTFPVYDETGQEISAYENIWRDISPQQVLGADCFLPQVDINPDENMMILKLTGLDFRKMFSALYNGAELTYPDEYLQIVTNFLSGLHCPPELDAEEGDCVNYLLYASFVNFEPQNPYNEPDMIPDGYEVPPFIVNTELGYPEALGYLDTDVFVQPAAINIDPIDLVTLNLPTIKISVTGSGQIELDFLSVLLGSYAIIKVGSPPNLGDIIIDGITDGVTIIDLNNDSVSVPPESDLIISEEINIEAEIGVLTEIFIVFVPTIDDSLIPLRFGGGLRQIGLCGFETVGSISGVEDIKFDTATCTFQKRVEGVWEIIEGGDLWLDCVPESGGGVGLGTMAVSTRKQALGANRSTTSTTFVAITGSDFTHYFTKENALIMATAHLALNAAATLQIRPAIVGYSGHDGTVGEMGETTARTIMFSETFENIAIGEQTVRLEWKVSASTGNISQLTPPVFTIIEYDDDESAALDYVQNIRIQGRELQQQKEGAWETVDESLGGYFDAIDSAISSINATNASQQTQINTATTVNATQNGRLTVLETEMNAVEVVQAAHDARLDSAESRLDDIDLSIAGLIVEQATQNGRLDDLEAASGGGSDLGSWGGYRLRAITDINTNGAKYSSSENTYDTGTFPFTFVGWIPNAFSVVKVNVENAGRFNSMAYLRVGIVTESLVSGAFFLARINGGEWSNIMQNSGGNWTGWLKVPQIDQYPSAGNHDMEIEIQSNNSDNEWRWKGAVWAYINVNPFDGTTSD